MENANGCNSAYLAKEPIGKLLFSFSVPCILAMLVSSLYNIVRSGFYWPRCRVFGERSNKYRISLYTYRACFCPVNRRRFSCIDEPIARTERVHEEQRLRRA